MNREEMLSTIMNIINEVTDIPVDEMEEDSSIMGDLELSSFEVLTSFAKIEKAFEVRITEDDLQDIDTIADVIECVNAKRA